MNNKAPRCGICGRGFWTHGMVRSHITVAHVAFAVVRSQVQSGKLNDWRTEDSNEETKRNLPRHDVFMTSSQFSTHPSFAWESQLKALLKEKHVQAHEENSPYGE